MNLFLRIAAALALVVALAAPRASAAEAVNPSLQKEVESYLAETPPATGGDTTAKAFFKNGLQFETADKSFTAHLGGRLEFDQAYFGSDGDYGGAQKQDSWYFRELFTVVEGTIYTNGFFRVELDFASGAVGLKDCFLALKNLGPAGTFQAGSYKVITCLSDQTSLRFVTFMERPACVNAFAYSYQDGFSLFNNFLEGNMLYGGVEAFKVSANGTATDNGGYGFATRWAVAFLEDKDKNQILQLGINFVYSTTPGGTIQYRARPNIGTGARLVDTGTFAAHEASTFDFELLFTWEKLHVQAEFFWVDVSGNAGPEPTFTGFYVEVGYWLIGGNNNYNKGAKKLDRPKVTEMFHAGSGKGRGAWQVAIQFDNVDLSDGAVVGGEQDCITFGVRWFWNPQMCWKFNIIWADISNGGPFGEGNMTVFGTRFQVDF